MSKKLPVHPRAFERVDPLVSPQDADLRCVRWRINARGYVETRAQGQRVLHRVVMERVLARPLAAGEVVDHINGDPLDNRRENLRAVSRAGNQQNRKPRAGRSVPRGVYFHKGAGKWLAQVGHMGRRHYLGLFETAEEAGKAAAAKRAELGFLTGAEVAPRGPSTGGAP